MTEKMQYIVGGSICFVAGVVGGTVLWDRLFGTVDDLGAHHHTIELNDPIRLQASRALETFRCFACDKKKSAGFPFCKDCVEALPASARQSLHHVVDPDYARVWNKALLYLVERQNILNNERDTRELGQKSRLKGEWSHIEDLMDAYLPRNSGKTRALKAIRDHYDLVPKSAASVPTVTAADLRQDLHNLEKSGDEPGTTERAA